MTMPITCSREIMYKTQKIATTLYKTHKMKISTFSREIPNMFASDRGNIRESVNQLKHPELGANGCLTLYETFRRGAALNPLGPCLGSRGVSANGEVTPYNFLSYTECIERMNCLAAGLDTLGLIEANQDNLKLLGLYMKNCTEWILAEHAIYALGGTTVPLYDTLGQDTVQFILNETEMTSLVCTKNELRAVCEAKKFDQCPHLRYAILLDEVIPAEASAMAKGVDVEVLSFTKVEDIGAQVIAKQGGTHKHTPPSEKDICTFCYTSGTTGDPKGVMLTHENMVAAMAEMDTVFSHLTTDRHLSYLPLGHVFECVVMSQVLWCGASVGFSRGNPLLLIQDIQALRPTVLPVVPRVLNKIHDKIQAGMAAAGGMKQSLFNAALHAKTEGLKHGHLKHGLYDFLIFNRIKKALGMDQIRFVVSGSAPLSESVMTFFRCLLGVPIVEGYGQTEGAAVATVGASDDQISVGHVGAPASCCEIVLVDVPGMGYKSTDTEHNGKACMGRGEIWVRGPNVFVGYYKDEAKTREVLDEDGWLHSGDIGLWTIQGQLQIIDRKKNIFKLSQGEYVAPEKIENILNQSSLVAQSFVQSDSLQTCLTSVIVPEEESVRAWATNLQQGQELSKLPMAELCKHPILQKTVMEDIKHLSKENGLHGFETVKAIYLEPELFSLENDFVTPTFKLKRNKLRHHYKKLQIKYI